MLNTKQTKIYEGLAQMSEAIGGFYLDAVTLVNSPFWRKYAGQAFAVQRTCALA